MNRDFIKFLGNKLKTGNLRSIHLNALPGRYATRLDVTNLDIIDSENLPGVNYSTSELFLFEHLLKQACFQFKVSLESVSLTDADEAKIRSYGVLAKRLSSLESENEDNFLEHGIQTFGFGYPLLIKRSKKDPTKIIKAPLLIWNLDIERSHSQRNQWTIRKTEDSPIYLNEVLISHLNSDEAVAIEGISDSFMDDNVIDESELSVFVKSVLSQLDADIKDISVRLQRANDKDKIEKVTSHKPWIMWSGIFGLFRTQKQSIIKDTEKLLEEFDNFDFSQLTIEHFLLTTNSCVEIDPSQSEILNTLESDEYKVIQGPPGTGKSQSLTAIISNVLENQGKILVVCEKRTALEVIHNNLERAGLQNLVAFIEDVNRDRKRVIDTVRQVCDTVKWVYSGFNEEEYDQKLKTLAALQKEFDARNSNLNGRAFRGMKFRDLIAKYLKLKRLAENDLFSAVIFQLTDDEFNVLDATIQDAVDLYREVDNNAFVFDLLQSNIFSEHYSNSLKNEIFQKLQVEHDFLQSFDFTKITIGLSNLKTDTLSPEMLKEFDFEAFQTIHQLAKRNLDFWKGLVDQLSAADSFITSSSILGSNPFHRNIYSLKNLLADITRMRRYFESVNNCLGELERAIDATPVSRRQQPLAFHWSVRIRKYFGKSNKSVSDFWECLNSQIQTINHSSDHQFFNSKKNIVNFLSAKETTNFDLDFVCNEIQKCIDEQRNFREYFQWRRNKEELAELPKSCVSILASSVESAKWTAMFQYAYYARLIEKLEIDIQHFNENDSKLKRISELESDVRNLQQHKILKAFGLKQFHAIHAYNARGNINWLFNHRKNKQYGRKNSLRSIVHQEFDLFTQLFPVLLVTPTVASSILPLTQSSFDVVLFDEASQLRLEDTYPAVVRGKIKVISGDKHQMPPSSYFASDITLDAEQDDDDETVEDTQSNFDRTHPLFLAESESLLDFGNNNNPNIVNTSFLDFHYRSRHPYLIDFSNAAFYGLRLVPMPEKEAYRPITLVQVNGTYESTQTNQAEAEAIVKYIKKDFPVNEDGTYPSLGIATFNIQQRNLIKERLHEYSYSDAGFRKKLELIGEKKELFVKNLENIQGDERDVIILSTTFGLNAEGRFRQSFGPLNTGKGHRLLNVIVTRAKDHVIVFTSIPETVFTTGYQDALPTNGNRGKAILYAYLDYCRTVSKGDEERRQEILRVLAENCEEQNISHNQNLIESPFEQEVYDYLQDHISPGRIVPQFKLGGFRVDFMIVDEQSRPKIAIECDGAQWHSGVQAYAYDLHRQRILESQGLNVCRIWSKTWFPDPDKEVLKVVRFIKQFEPSAVRCE
jgi:superfamily I DNA and/or RNA helicase/very-short-patch-repair endonuclease